MISSTPVIWRCLNLIAAGRPNREIAAQLSCSIGTVKNSVQQILQKLSVSDLTRAAVIAARAGGVSG